MEHWDGPRWRWWSLAIGLLSVPLALVFAFMLSALFGQQFGPLAMLVLIAIILGGSLVGSGFVDSLTSRMTRGGLARESADFVEAAESERQRNQRTERDQEMRDRRTIRAGLFVVGPAAAFVYFMATI